MTTASFTYNKKKSLVNYRRRRVKVGVIEDVTEVEPEVKISNTDLLQTNTDVPKTTGLLPPLPNKGHPYSYALRQSKISDDVHKHKAKTTAFIPSKQT